MDLIIKAQTAIIETSRIQKAPPGPKPDKFGPDIFWDERSRRWRKPEEGEKDKHSRRMREMQRIFGVADEDVRELFDESEPLLDMDVEELAYGEGNLPFYEYKGIGAEFIPDDEELQEGYLTLTALYSHPDSIVTGGMSELLDVIESGFASVGLRVKVDTVLNPYLYKFLEARGYTTDSRQHEYDDWLEVMHSGERNQKQYEEFLNDGGSSEELYKLLNGRNWRANFYQA